METTKTNVMNHGMFDEMGEEEFEAPYIGYGMYGYGTVLNGKDWMFTDKLRDMKGPLHGGYIIEVLTYEMYNKIDGEEIDAAEEWCKNAKVGDSFHGSCFEIECTDGYQ